ncbi:hypothetical protein KY289_026409 [Solanum tuberosum]|nr:hypothetical protein KY289_026409 [Solanum tuberosum]
MGATTRELGMWAIISGPILSLETPIIGLNSAFSRAIPTGMFRPHYRLQWANGIVIVMLA